MSEEQSRGRRRPSREYHQAASTSRRPREPSISEEPRAKVFRRELDSPYEKPSTSRETTKKPPNGGNGKKRRERQSYEIVHTKPSDVVSKQGSGGKPIRLIANYYRLLTTPMWVIHQYHVTFAPEVELRCVRGGLIYEYRAALGGYLYDGMKLFSTNKLSEDQTYFQTTSKNKEKYVISFKHVGEIAMDQWESLQVLNLIIRRAMDGLKLQPIQRNYYDPLAKIDIREHRMQLWPGYQTSVRQHERDILLCTEIAHKVMRTETVYDILQRCHETSGNYQEDFRRHVLGMTVLTDYNNKTYSINDIDFTKSPKETFVLKGKEISFMDYYYTRYNLRIRDGKQPLLISKAKLRSIRGGEKETIILIPELCRPTGLTDTMRSNMQLMRAMADHTRLEPGGRMDRLRTFNNRLQHTEDSIRILREWNMNLDRELVELPGRILEPQRIVFQNHAKVSSGDNADWTRSFRDHGLFTTPTRGLERWSAISPTRASREIRSFVETLIRAARGMNMKIDRPTEVMIHDDRNHTYIQAMEECCRRDPQLVLCLVPNNNAERYASIKKKSYLERAVPTQVITQKSAGNQRGLMSIATKVAIQINCKLGYTPWMIDLPLSGLMTIGYDISKCPREKSKAFCALVASMDMKQNATFYSTVAECNPGDALASNLWPMMTKALRQYRKEHDKLPNRILFYRDGIGEGSLKQVYEHEVRDIVEKLEAEYKRSQHEKPPMFAYVIVTKSINTRFFHEERNPPPGTVVDDVVTLPERYDFFLVSQSVRQGTVSPTSYNVVHSTIRLSADQMQLLTYKMCHLYYNWSGTTRVPAVCQYAKKLASLVSTALFQPPQNALEKKLYYL
uniref:Piwi n=1 Tax=Glossina brevipalpis TaxID=37001 RepID=A0A1A9W0S0_9MUSC